MIYNLHELSQSSFRHTEHALLMKGLPHSSRYHAGLAFTFQSVLHRLISAHTITHVFLYLVGILEHAEAYGTLEVVGNFVYEHMVWLIVRCSRSRGWCAASGRSRGNGRTAHSLATLAINLLSLTSPNLLEFNMNTQPLVG